VTSPIRVLRQIIAPTGRHRPRRRTVTLNDLIGQPSRLPSTPAFGVFVQAWDDCEPCGKATAGVLHKDGWMCGECLTSTAVEGDA
jgi:ribosomal protein S27AE